MKKKYRPFSNKQVEEVFNRYPDKVQAFMLDLRELILKTADGLEFVSELEETLKWGEPAYLNLRPRTGTTLRIDWKAKNPDYASIFVNCQTSLIEMIRLKHTTRFQFEGKRALHLSLKKKLPIKVLQECIELILGYHVKK